MSQDRTPSPHPRRTSATPPRAALVLGQLIGTRGPAPGLLHDRRAQYRRRHSLWSFLYGGLRPRRRTGRRRGDEHHVFFDWHEPGVFFLALAIFVMSCADALFTLTLLALGGEELNHLMRLLLAQGTHWFLWTKFGLTAFGIIVLVTGARRVLLGRLPVMWLIWLLFTGYVALIGWEIYLLGWYASSIGPEVLDSLTIRLAG